MVIGVVWWVNRQEPLEVLTGASAIERFQQDFPNSVVKEVLVSDDGRNAFLKLSQQPEIGLVHAVGQNCITRLLDRKVIVEFKSSGNSIDLRLREFTLKKLSFKDTNLNAREFLSEALERELS